MYKILDITSRLSVRITEAVSIFILYVMTSIVLYQTIARYVFSTGLPWPEEVAKLLMVWIACFGAAILVYEESHIAVLFLLERLSVRVQLKLKICFFILIAFFATVLFYSGAIYAIRDGKSILPGSDIRFFWLYVPLPISGIFMLLYSSTLIARTIRQIQGDLESTGVHSFNESALEEEIEVLQGSLAHEKLSDLGKEANR